VELLDRFLTRPMFFLAFGFLLLSAGLIHRMGHDDQTPFEHAVILWGLVGLWPVFVCEGMLRLVVCRRPGTGGWQRLAIFLAVCLFPPFRLGGRAYANPEQLWLPGLGWNTVGSHLQARLERLFCVPMVITALLVLPLLALEYFWLEAVRAHFGLSLLLDIGTSVIWLAFATELIVMVSLADNKARYCWQNWMDVAVVFLPLVDFLPLLRLVRLIGFLEVQQLSRLGRLYRLRGLLSKIWRTILLLEVIQHLLGNYRERRLQRLKELLATRRQEIDELHKEIADLENLLAGQKMPADESVAGRTDLDER
jgi:hypothetical protein